ncbi:recombinase family protein [Emticicia sp. BO119]|uniref:recombinase family protein n=1 Tax=Emticicia sp. BO119 TaxID=2757768 RepID=UPI0015F11FF0|nr:recombinase family protein [Emticicia sp. BO119]MBA4850466.1 recombinase family protein [Emticicia sp. BO119]
METKQVGLWIRVSTDMQVQDESPEHHERRARMYAEAKGWNIVTIYRLDAMSGKSVMEYPETKRMLADIKNGTISGIIFSKLARLARNTKELLEISDIFQKEKADLISIAENIDTSTPAGRLFFTIIAAISQWEREEIAERVRASVPIRALMGKPLGGQASLGYKWVAKELVIDEQEAPIRKLIYEIFQQTRRIQTTAKELNKRGFRTRNGALFSDTTIERLITDTTAKGIRIANYSKSPGAGKPWTLKPKEEWIEVKCPPIVSEDLWEECNYILTHHIKREKKAARPPIHFLTGYIYCSCGKKMYILTETRNYYKCKPCKRKIAVEDIEEIYHHQLKAFLLTDADVTTYSQKTAQFIEEKEVLLKTIKSDYEKLKKKTGEMLDMRLNGELSKEDFSSFYLPSQIQLRQMEEQLPDLEAEIDFLRIQSLSSDVILGEAKDLYNNWKMLPHTEKRQIVETITQQIVINTDTIDISLAFLPDPSFHKIHENVHASKRLYGSQCTQFQIILPES